MMLDFFGKVDPQGWQGFYGNHLTTDNSPRVVSTSADFCKLIAKVSTHFATTMIVVDGLDEITENRSGVTRTLQMVLSRNYFQVDLKQISDMSWKLSSSYQSPLKAMICASTSLPIWRRE